jgi:hypothetical protein
MPPLDNNQDVVNNSLRTSDNRFIRLVSLGLMATSILGALYYLTISSVVSALFWGTFISNMLYQVLEVKDSQGLDTVLNLPNGDKVSIKLAGAVAAFAAISLLAWWGLEREAQRKSADIAQKMKDQEKPLEIDKQDTNSQESHYYLATQDSYRVGKINIYDQLYKLRKDNPFSHVLENIRQDCSEDRGLCGIPESFDVKIVGSVPDIESGGAYVCKLDREYLVNNSFKITSPKIKPNIPDTIKITNVNLDSACKRFADPKYLNLVVSPKHRELVNPEITYHIKLLPE